MSEFPKYSSKSDNLSQQGMDVFNARRKSLQEEIIKARKEAKNSSGILKRAYEYAHNHSLLNQIVTTNNTKVTFPIIMDYTSDSDKYELKKGLVMLSSGSTTVPEGDTDIILPPNSSVVFVTKEGIRSKPGQAIRTSGKGNVMITEEGNNIYNVYLEQGLTPSEIYFIDNPITDVKSGFRHVNGLDKLREEYMKNNIK